MTDPLSPDERGWLLDALGEVVDAGGMETFLSAAILEPTPRDFPDPFTPDAAGVRTLVARLAGHAGLAGRGLVVEAIPDLVAVGELGGRHAAPPARHPTAPAWFAGLDGDGRCRFGVAEERLGSPEALVATLCQEVARAWRAVHGTVAADPAVEERLVDVTAVYLGFGLLTSGDDSGHRHCGRGCGPRSRAGSLPPQATSFLLAALAKARGMGWLARRRLAGRLQPNPAAYFAWAHRALPDAGALRAALGAHVVAT
jgi:hypothetical protein